MPRGQQSASNKSEHTGQLKHTWSHPLDPSHSSPRFTAGFEMETRVGRGASLGQLHRDRRRVGIPVRYQVRLSAAPLQMHLAYSQLTTASGHSQQVPAHTLSGSLLTHMCSQSSRRRQQGKGDQNQAAAHHSSNRRLCITTGTLYLIELVLERDTIVHRPRTQAARLVYPDGCVVHMVRL